MQSARLKAAEASGVYVTRVELSIGALDLFRFVRYDHAFPRHSHDRFTVGVFGPQNGTIRFRGGDWQAREGSILAIPPDEAHSADPLRGSGWTYRTFYPSTELVALAVEDSGQAEKAFFERPILDDPPLARSLIALHNNLLSPSHGLAVEETLLLTLRDLLLRHATERAPSTAPTFPARAVAAARAYLDQHYAQNVKLAELSSVCGMSPFHLIRSFRDVVGMPPHAYLTQVRANRARSLLVSGETLSATAYMCGFADQSHLTRTFKRIFGVTPGVYLSAYRLPSVLPT
jgi:AraC-like DNA-binding protein